ncbi:LOW QUALITY PROTEIN: hypothetical protein OSB04_031883 [Centaurea solstitialis]|uniref:Reverse transcriptase zinc-binding domain-containing protein n=1 Tax=Centaurea solstitialis TaxID=347529 RepID=A0AA38W562_9ASTR|nr:LOW QUALITY PROTEIN: hypothetical protein OSB04_031883 [Centaurea solstitialis]
MNQQLKKVLNLSDTSPVHRGSLQIVAATTTTIVYLHYLIHNSDLVVVRFWMSALILHSTNDLFVFTRGDVASVEVLKKTLSLFATRSGMSPNLQKSDVFFGHVAPNVQAAIIECLPFRSGSFPIGYLGVPLSPVSLKMVDYGVLVTKVKHRLQNWKSKVLSFGGRKQHIISVLQSLQLYWMAIFLFPSGIIHELESLFRNFLWAQGDSSRGRCKVAWSLVCRPKECGGLGFRHLAAWNCALIAKYLWAILSSCNCLWIRHYSIRDMVFWSARRTNRWSWVLVKMMGIRSDLRRYVSVHIGNGLTTNAWEYAWLSCGPLSMFISHRFIHAASFYVSITVQQLLEALPDGWPITWIKRYPILASTGLPTIIDGADDVRCWNLASNGGGEFTVQKAYQAFVGQFPTVSWRTLFGLRVITKHSFYLWTACLLRLPTQDRIAEWKHEPPDLKCSLCGIVRDSHNHLFFECTFSRQRNRRLFVGDSKPIPHPVQLILSCVFDRIAWKWRKKVLTMHDVVS